MPDSLTPVDAELDPELVAATIVNLRRALRRSDRPRPGTKERGASEEVLHYVSAHPGVGTNRIATALRLSPNTISGVCARLVRENRLRRERDPRDSRAAQFFVTASRSEVHDRRAATVAEALGRLDPVDRAALARAMGPLRRFAEALDVSG